MLYVDFCLESFAPFYSLFSIGYLQVLILMSELLLITTRLK